MSPGGEPGALLIVVEDDQGIGLLERRALERRGHRVLMFGGAEAALAAEERFAAECWLIDQALPGGRSGLDLVADLHAQGIYAPVVLVTANEEPDIVLRALRAGVGDFVQKGEGFVELLVTRVDAMIAQARAERELQVSRARAEIEQQRRHELEAEIAERRRAEAQAHTALARLREADRRKNEFLAMLGHELRNPLAPIASAVEVLLAAPDDRDRVLQAAGIVSRQIEQLRRLVDDLLDVARIMNGRLQLQRVAIDLGDVLARAAERVGPTFAARRHELRVRSSPTPVVVRGDAVRLTQVVANLLDNAAKYTPEGGHVTLELSVDGGVAEVGVHDDGLGLREDEIEELFGLFVQGVRTPDRAEGGLGLGLSLVRRIVTMHGGEAGATSSGPGRGSRFYVRLPLAGAEVRALEPVPPRQPLPSAEPRGQRVLVVDDNIDAADAAAMLLRLWGLDVAIEHEGHAAVARIASFDPQAVLLDLGLPGLDGLEVLAAARAAQPDRQRSWIAVTGYGQEVDRQQTRAAGFDAHLVKPVDADELRRCLGALLAP